MTSVTYTAVFLLLAFLPHVDTSLGDLAIGDITHSSMNLTLSSGFELVVIALEAEPSAGVTFEPTVEDLKAAARARSVKIQALGLTPGTLYTLTVEASLFAGTEAADFEFTGRPRCTKPLPVTDLAVVEAETNTSHIKISWTNPASSSYQLKVAFNDHEVTLPDARVTDAFLTLSAAATPLTADEKGNCKVIVVLTDGGDCNLAENVVGIDCQASNPPVATPPPSTPPPSKTSAPNSPASKTTTGSNAAEKLLAPGLVLLTLAKLMLSGA